MVFCSIELFQKILSREKRTVSGILHVLASSVESPRQDMDITYNIYLNKKHRTRVFSKSSIGSKNRYQYYCSYNHYRFPCTPAHFCWLNKRFLGFVEVIHVSICLICFILLMIYCILHNCLSLPL